MNTGINMKNDMLDTVKLAISLLVVVMAIFGFYFYEEQSLLLRVVGLLASTGIAVAIAMQTVRGKNIWLFFRASQVELRKVVWPTRQETVQVTLMVVLVVIVIAIVLWLLDMFLGWSIGSLMRQGI